jgi:hypothetical protein
MAAELQLRGEAIEWRELEGEVLVLSSGYHARTERQIPVVVLEPR